MIYDDEGPSLLPNDVWTVVVLALRVLVLAWFSLLWPEASKCKKADMISLLPRAVAIAPPTLALSNVEF